jgi:hypothetical protein
MYDEPLASGQCRAVSRYRAVTAPPPGRYAGMVVEEFLRDI